MHSGDKASPIVYFTLLVGENCSHMMINRTLEHVHLNVLMISSLLIVLTDRQDNLILSDHIHMTYEEKTYIQHSMIIINTF